jgi:hypothetical protein
MKRSSRKGARNFAALGDPRRARALTTQINPADHARSKKAIAT